MRWAAGLAALAALAIAQPASAEVVTERQLRFQAQVKTEIARNLDASFSQHLRMGLNGEHDSRVMPELNLAYEPFKHLSMSTGGRYSFDRDDENGRSSTVRILADVEAETPQLGPFQCAYRFRVQRDASTNKDDPSVRLRHKASLQLNTDSALTPDAFYEHFDDPNADKKQRAQQSRLGAGIAIKLGANHRFKLKAFQDTELDGDGDKERVLAAGYRYGF